MFDALLADRQVHVSPLRMPPPDDRHMTRFLALYHLYTPSYRSASASSTRLWLVLVAARILRVPPAT